MVADRSVRVSLRDEAYVTQQCGNEQHLQLYGTSLWIFDTSSHKHIIFFLSRNSFAPMLCLTVVPFVEPDADKCIQHQCHARALVTCEMRGNI